MWNDHNNYCQYLLSLIMSGVALCISIFCLIYLLPAKNISFDYIGVIVGILSILVTVLMTWNIFSVIDFKEKTKKVELLEKNKKMRCVICLIIWLFLNTLFIYHLRKSKSGLAR